MDVKHRYDGTVHTRYSYKGLGIHAAKGVHEEIFNQVKTQFPTDLKVLVLGAGSGAFDARLIDNGYTNLTSVELNEVNYKFDRTKVNFHSLDLNTEFQNEINDTFDLIITMEVVEHLFSTKDFLRRCDILLAPGGKILLSTPNVHDVYSKIIYLFYGTPNRFVGVPVLYEHINPIFDGILVHLLDLNGLVVEERLFFGSTLLESLDQKTSIPRLIGAGLVYLVGVFIKLLVGVAKLLGLLQNKCSNFNGDISCYIIRRKTSEDE